MDTQNFQVVTTTKNFKRALNRVPLGSIRSGLPLASRIEHIGTRTHPVHLICEVRVNWPKYGLEPFDRLLRIVIVLLRDIKVERSSSRHQLQLSVRIYWSEVGSKLTSASAINGKSRPTQQKI